jgi:hypothetical protein
MPGCLGVGRTESWLKDACRLGCSIATACLEAIRFLGMAFWADRLAPDASSSNDYPCVLDVSRWFPALVAKETDTSLSREGTLTNARSERRAVIGRAAKCAAISAKFGEKSPLWGESVTGTLGLLSHATVMLIKP